MSERTRKIGLRRLHWRKMTWVINVWTLVAAVFIISAVTDNSAKACKGDQTCVGLAQMAQGIAVAGFTLIWFIGFLALSFVWFMTRPPRRVCPHCSAVVRPRPACKNCGYDFTALA